MKNKALELLDRLSLTIQTIHLDMGGKHKYALTNKSHPIITEIRSYLSEVTEQDNPP